MEDQERPTSETAGPQPPETMVQAPMKKRYKALGFILVFLILGGLIGFFWWLYMSQFEETDDATISAHIAPISTRINGTIIRVLVDNNDYVKAGQLLVELDPTDYRLALQQAGHNLKTANAQAKTAQNNVLLAQEQAKSQITQAQGGIGSSKGNISQAQGYVKETQASISAYEQALVQKQASYQKIYADYQRYIHANPEAVSAQQIQLAKTNLQVADAAVKSAQADLTQAKSKFNQALASLASNVARMEQAKGVYQGAQAQKVQVSVNQSQYHTAKAQENSYTDAVKLAQLNLDYTRIVAPVSGKVGQRNAEIGQRVEPGQPLMAIVQPGIWVAANFKETQLQKMRTGQPVEIRVDAYPDHPFKGYIESFSPASGAKFALLPPENATGNFTKIVQRVPVRIFFKDDGIKGYEKRLVPGLSVMVKVNVGR